MQDLFDRAMNEHPGEVFEQTNFLAKHAVLATVIGPDRRASDRVTAGVFRTIRTLVATAVKLNHRIRDLSDIDDDDIQQVFVEWKWVHVKHSTLNKRMGVVRRFQSWQGRKKPTLRLALRHDLPKAGPSGPASFQSMLVTPEREEQFVSNVCPFVGCQSLMKDKLQLRLNQVLRVDVDGGARGDVLFVPAGKVSVRQRQVSLLTIEQRHAIHAAKQLANPGTGLVVPYESSLAMRREDYCYVQALTAQLVDAAHKEAPDMRGPSTCEPYLVKRHKCLLAGPMAKDRDLLERRGLPSRTAYAAAVCTAQIAGFQIKLYLVGGVTGLDGHTRRDRYAHLCAEFQTIGLEQAVASADLQAAQDAFHVFQVSAIRTIGLLAGRRAIFLPPQCLAKGMWLYPLFSRGLGLTEMQK